MEVTEDQQLFGYPHSKTKIYIEDLSRRFK